MKSHRIHAVLLASAAFAFSGSLHAQTAPADAGSGSAAATAPVAPAPVAPDPVAPAAAPAMTAEELATSGRELQASAAKEAKDMLALQAEARQNKDVIQLACVNDKAVSLKGEQNLLDDQVSHLDTTNDASSAAAALDTAKATGERIRKLREEAGRCAGKQELTSNLDNAVSAPDVPDDPTTGMPFSDNGTPTVVEVPGYASPYR